MKVSFKKLICNKILWMFLQKFVEVSIADEGRGPFCIMAVESGGVYWRLVIEASFLFWRVLRSWGWWCRPLSLVCPLFSYFGRRLFCGARALLWWGHRRPWGFLLYGDILRGGLKSIVPFDTGHRQCPLVLCFQWRWCMGGSKISSEWGRWVGCGVFPFFSCCFRGGGGDVRAWRREVEGGGYRTVR